MKKEYPDFREKQSNSEESRFLEFLKNGDLLNALEIKNNFNIPEEFLQSVEVIEVAKIWFLKRLENGDLYDALMIRDNFNIPEEFLQSVEVIKVAKIGFLKKLKSGDISDALKIKNNFIISEEFLQGVEVIEAAKIGLLGCLKNTNLGYTLKVKDVLKNEFALQLETTKTFDKVYNIFGDKLTYNIYLKCEHLLNGEVSDEIKKFGVTIGGEAGINQLRSKFREYSHGIIINQGFDAEELIDSKLKRATFQGLVQYTGSQWGSHGEEEFEETIETYLSKKDSLRSLPEVYVPSEVMGIKKIKQIDAETFEYSEQFLSKYGNLLKSLKRGSGYAKKKEDGIREIISKLEESLGNLKASLEDKKRSYEKKISNEEDEKERNKMERALARLPEKIGVVSKINLKSIQNPIELFETLHSLNDNDINEILKDLMFYVSFQLKPELQQTKDLSEFDKDAPTVADISWVMDTIQHIVLQETVEPYFTKQYFDPEEKLKPKDRKRKEIELQTKIRKLFNVSALNDELSKMTGETSTDTIKMQFVPQRNLLTEFSGHFSDACWASQYDSILEEFPNFISVAMIQNPGNPKHEKIAGGSFLIEAKAQNGEDLLIIRGLNPQENLINQLSPEDFYENFIRHFKEIAERQGRKLAIVIDDHSGGSSTNRPLLYEFLNKLKNNLRKVKLAFDEETNFNGYKIVDDCYLVG